jgi:polar amino acid transport system substrate-binding protein
MNIRNHMEWTMRKGLFFAAALAACLMLAGAALAADASLDKVKARGELVIGFAAHYPPFESKNEKTGEYEGFDVDMARALAGELGVAPKFVDTDWQALLGGLGKGDFDVLVTCLSKSETRGQNVNFTDVYYKLADVVVVRKDETAITGADGLKGKVVGAQLGSSADDIMNKMQGLKDAKHYNYNPEAFLDLKAGRLDALIVGYAYAVNQIKEDPSYKIVGAPLEEAEIVMVLPQGADALTGKLNEALAAIRKNGKYQAAFDKWLKID